MAKNGANKDRLKRISLMIGIVLGVSAIAGVLSVVVDRPVLYRAEFVPLAQHVELLLADKNSNDFFYAKRQLDLIAERIETLKKAGKSVTADDHKDLRYWQKQVRDLRVKIKIK